MLAVTLLDAVTETGAGPALNLGGSFAYFTPTLVAAGTWTGDSDYAVYLEGSQDSENWFQLVGFTGAEPVTQPQDATTHIVNFVRGNAAALGDGSGQQFTLTVLYRER